MKIYSASTFSAIALFLFSSVVLANETQKMSKLGIVSSQLYFGTGVVSFQDIYVPLSNTDFFNPNLRADGSTREEDMRSHIGISMELGFALRYDKDRYALNYHLGYFHASSLGKQNLNGGAACSNVFTGASGFYAVLPQVYLGLGLSGQRLAFSNISQGHSVLSILPRAETKVYVTANTTVEGFFGYAVYNTVGYFENNQILSKKIQSSDADVLEMGISAEQKIGQTMSVSLTLSQKNIAIRLADINVYKAFGLTLIAPEPTPKNMSLTTRTASISLNKLF